MKEEFFDSQLAREIWEKKYRNGNESFDEWLDRISGNNEEIKKLILQKKFIFGGRILSNRGLTGSLSNCYTSGHVGDSLDEIMDVAKNIALTFKAQGGNGVSLSLIRPKGSMINNRYKSDGIVPFMEIFDNVAANISQGGSRRGALLMSIDITHKEAETFIKIKSDLNKINNANLSLEITDKFMDIVEDYYKTGEVKVIEITEEYNNQTISYTITPINLFKLLCKHAHDYAEPGVLFMDRINEYNLNQFDDNYQIECTNPCGM
jgi:ribonucleoside-diphosphate reductase alpha chain